MNKDGSSKEYKTVFSPYRICPLGAHVDHQNGLVTGFTIDQGITLKYKKSDNGYIKLKSQDFPDEEYFHIKSIIGYIPGAWGNYIRGAVLAISRKYIIENGIEGIAHGSLPIGGLSSSAAVSSAYLLALADVNGITLSQKEIIDMVQYIENEYIGLKNGVLDQSVNVLSKKDHLLYLDTLTNEYTSIPLNNKTDEFEIMIVYSGLSKSLIATNYNQRVDECRAASWYLKDTSGQKVGPFKHTKLRDISLETFEKHKDYLPAMFKKRATHFFSENERVKKGVEAWEQGDLKTFGQLVFESGESSITNYESGTPELIDLFNIMKNVDGIYGARFSGGGYRGCIISFINPKYKNEIKEEILKKYIKMHPEYENVAQIDFCKMDDGVRIL